MEITQNKGRFDELTDNDIDCIMLRYKDHNKDNVKVVIDPETYLPAQPSEAFDAHFMCKVC